MNGFQNQHARPFWKTVFRQFSNSLFIGFVEWPVWNDVWATSHAIIIIALARLRRAAEVLMSLRVPAGAGTLSTSAP
tara:strand:+ start:1289 stop:1519 length:231 start_codon:yes stop_codon:yes gene_type:complete